MRLGPVVLLALWTSRHRQRHRQRHWHWQRQRERGGERTLTTLCSPLSTHPSTCPKQAPESISKLSNLYNFHTSALPRSAVSCCMRAQKERRTRWSEGWVRSRAVGRKEGDVRRRSLACVDGSLRAMCQKGRLARERTGAQFCKKVRRTPESRLPQPGVFPQPMTAIQPPYIRGMGEGDDIGRYHHRAAPAVVRVEECDRAGEGETEEVEGEVGAVFCDEGAGEAGEGGEEDVVC
ncbi:hypothetical protein CALVIDRAFT_24363 [Calocera viscosa TUFC12733]|uniref:Uncharacterized protein n=1 Tax=Calocera viscosa (strain TUFC12733) TaxID=1330018 RepID=A0A167P7Q1_CALVF|nr:hypothetical protein CALVIDRAFT_24363 [Calocera viscosa TUFC12733]